MKESIKPNGEKYWSYIIVYVDDILCIHHDPRIPMKQISNIYRMKEWSLQDENGQSSHCWAQSSETYTRKTVRVM